MSQFDNIDALEKQLADLQTNVSSINRIKKVPPAVPPKKKAQPQVPHSAVVSTLCGPSYSSKILTTTPSDICNYPNLSSMRQSNVNNNFKNIDHLNLSPGSSLQHSSNTYSPTYSNVTFSTHQSTLPPPPPPLPSTISYNINTRKGFENENEEYIPPPSPVSSNYSELVRATANLNYNNDGTSYPHIYQNEYPEYETSQNSTTYESLYEPITLRPQSNMSIQNDNMRSLGPQNTARSPLPKEEEVDALTNLLVQSISDSQDLDVFGVCVKCKEKVVGESSGCTAMGNMYHIKCFHCYKCKTNLQGKAFYAVEGQPFCETDYYETLEKCSVCNQPILDRILRATGKPYHPNCFTCVVCGKSLDGIPFTVDAMNQIHCIEDFHKKFAPRCCVCELPIMPEEGEEETVRVVALDRSFHVRCYRCEDCGLRLSSEAEGRGCYPLDDHILCKNCNAHRIRMLTNVMTTDL